MNYSDTKLQSLLSAEYVLGSLQGLARKRFERLLTTEPGLQEAVEYWQRRLNPLGETVEPLEPPHHIWQQIQQRIQPPAAPVAAEAESSMTKIANAWWDSLEFWRGFGVATAMMIVGLFVAFNTQTSFNKQPEYLAILQNQQAQPMFVASLIQGGKALEVSMLAEMNMQSHEVMQIWCVPKDGGVPVSVGLLESGRTHFELSLDQLQGLHDAEELLISLEPVGGSTEQGPSGPVMYRGPTMI